MPDSGAERRPESSASGGSEGSSQDGSGGSSVYALLGGEAGVRCLVDRFYDLMALEPAYAQLRSLHPALLDGSRDKLFWYLSGWLGGPNLYIERFGHPRLRARHLPYSIGVVERDQWLACMRQAMIDQGVEPWLRERLEAAFDKTADWMRNRAE
ncbi:MAG: group II truncated hemoglobin [Burkholderiaceae bacterium]